MKVVAIGNAGIDRYVDLGADRAGGMSLNFAVNARRLFRPDDAVAVASAVGADPEAAIVRRAAAEAGLRDEIVALPGRTSIQYIDREPSGEKVFVHYDAGVLTGTRVGAPWRALIAGSDVMMASIYGHILGFAESALEVPSAGLRAADFMDLSYTTDRAEPVARFIDRLDVCFAGLGVGDAGLIDGLERLARDRGRLVVVTLGAAGSVALGGPKRLECPARAVAGIVDTTGAGDSFAAGFLACYARARDVAASLAAGTAAAAESLGHVGAFDAPMQPWPRRSVVPVAPL
jgi:fructoselysine 6-kinase